MRPYITVVLRHSEAEARSAMSELTQRAAAILVTSMAARRAWRMGEILTVMPLKRALSVSSATAFSSAASPFEARGASSQVSVVAGRQAPSPFSVTAAPSENLKHNAQ